LQQGAGAFPMATAQVMRMCGEFNGSVGVFWSKELARHWQISSYFIIFHDVSVSVCYLERGNGFKWFLYNAGPLKGFFVDSYTSSVIQKPRRVPTSQVLITNFGDPPCFHVAQT
jgi:hypothetical protein